MDTGNQINQVQNHSGSQSDLGERLRHSKALIPTMAVMDVTVMALAAALVVGRSEAQPGGAAALSATAAQGAHQSAQPPAKLAANTVNATNSARRPALVAQAPKSVACPECGTVESVTPVTRAAPASGVGAVAGGVVGGLLGNQMGGGNGKTAMTVLGAVGGGFAGNAIEKNMNKTTSYQMRVRMNDGSVRTIEQSSAVAAGSRVVVQGNTLRLAATSAAAVRPSYSARLA